MKKTNKKEQVFERFGMIASKLGNQIHMRTLRDAFATFMPFMMLAGFVTLINYVILEPTGFMGKIVKPETLMKVQEIGMSTALLIAIFIFSRRKDYKDFAKLSVTPTMFNISEPIIFGLPIVFNLRLIIPFVLAPIFSLVTAYFATAAGLINHVVVQIPWTTPPVISGFLATGGDWRAAVLQVLIIAVSVFIYLPFLRIDEHVTAKMAQKEAEITNQ